ncbi:MAG: class I adenylate-forming enzyme family protein [Candidatus Omnitrophota bacterium]
MDIRNLLIQHFQNCPRKPAIIFGDRVIDFLEIKDSSFRLANYLLKAGFSESDKAALYLSNTPDAVTSFLGVFSAGLTVVPLDFMLTQEEIIHFINHSEAKVLITQPKKGVDLEKIKNSCLGLKEIIVCKEEVSPFSYWGKVLESSCIDNPNSEINSGSLSSIFYTSGTTGHPKGVMLDYKHLSNPVKTIGHFLGVNENDVFLCGGVPFSHFGGLDYILLMIYFASTMILMERFHPLEFLKSIERGKVTIFCIVPAMYIAILSLKEYDKLDLSSLRYAVVFGAPSSPILLKRFNKACPNAKLSNGWGLTETAAPNCMLPPELDKIESIGKFAPGMEAKIVEGELWVKGEAVMRGYYKEEDLTKEVITEDGWFKTGDIARRDEQGLFYIIGRKKDMIKVAGEIVFPAEVEEKIQRHPQIEEAAVIGVADPLRGEVPKVFIVTNDKGRLEIQALKEFLKEHIAHFKIPHHFEFVESLPKNRTGKVDKSKLK